MEFTYKFKEARKACGLTQKEVAKALDITAATYSRYENGLIQPDPSTLKHIAELLKTTVDYLLGTVKTQEDKPAIQSKPAVRSDEEKLLGVYNSLDEKSKTQLMSVAYLMMADSLANNGINVSQLVEQQLHKIKDEGGGKND